MSPATSWAELSGVLTSWTRAFPIIASTADDFFSVFLFDGPGLEVLGPTPSTELSIAATAYTELSGVLTSYTELTL